MQDHHKLKQSSSYLSIDRTVNVFCPLAALLLSSFVKSLAVMNKHHEWPMLISAFILDSTRSVAASIHCHSLHSNETLRTEISFNPNPLLVMLQPVDADTQKAMMAFYHKKQEEQKVCKQVFNAHCILHMHACLHALNPNPKL